MAAPADVARAILAPCGICQDSEDDDTEYRERLAPVVLRLRQAYAAAAGEGDLTLLVGMANEQVAFGREALLTWLNLLEEITQLTEQLATQLYGSPEGKGKFKGEQAKAAVRYLVEPDNLPESASTAVIVDMFGPEGLDLITGVMIDVVVRVVNEGDVWEGGQLSGPRRRPRRRWSALPTRIVTFFVRPVARVMRWLERRPPLHPSLEDEVQQIALAGVTPLHLVGHAITTATWVADNKDQVLALVSIASIACDEAEFATTLSGPEKQVYVRELMLEVLEQEFGITLEGVFLSFAESIIDFVIDFIVDVYNKRGRF